MSLLWDDFCLILRSLAYVPGILLPLKPLPAGGLDELSLTAENLLIIIIHGALIVGQLAFIFSLPFCILLPISLFVTYFGGVILANVAICSYLNGWNRLLISQETRKLPQRHEDEFWVFINGVAVG
jgi:hypothetical protein